VISIRPFARHRVDPVVVNAIDDFLPIGFEFGGAAGKIFVNTRLGKGIVDGDHNRCVSAGGSSGLVVLRFYTDAVRPDGHDSLFPCFGQAVAVIESVGMLPLFIYSPPCFGRPRGSPLQIIIHFFVGDVITVPVLRSGISRSSSRAFAASGASGNSFRMRRHDCTSGP